MSWGPTKSIPEDIQRVIDQLKTQQAISEVAVMQQAVEHHLFAQVGAGPEHSRMDVQTSCRRELLATCAHACMCCAVLCPCTPLYSTEGSVGSQQGHRWQGRAGAGPACFRAGEEGF